MRKVKNTRKRKTKKKDLPRVPFLLKLLLLFKRLLLRPVCYVALFIAVLGCWYYISGMYAKTVEMAALLKQRFYHVFHLELEHVYLEGQEYTQAEDILAALDLNIGEPVLEMSLWDIKGRLETLPWVRFAAVERQYPSTVSVRIVEKQPTALWQYDGKMHVIDELGDVISRSDVKRFSDLIILVGKDVPLYAGNLMDMLSVDENLRKKVSSAIRIGERRWNIRLFNGVEIKLPEENYKEAWDYLIRLDKQKNILNGNVASVDLRVDETLYIKQN